jgi:GNAT superfamily N-acetyltransferase
LAGEHLALSRPDFAGCVARALTYHRSTTRIELTCYLQDLFTSPEARGQGVGRSLIEAVYTAAKGSGVKRVYWQTHHTNANGRALYDKVAKHHGFIVYAHDV